jgi:hypothetical protein
MTVADYVHHEGEHWIVETPVRTYSASFMGVTFRDGVGRTRDERKAKVFDEQFGYTVIPYEGAPQWANIKEGGPEFLPEWEQEQAPAVVEEELWETAVGQFEHPVKAAKAARRGLTSVVPDN